MIPPREHHSHHYRHHQRQHQHNGSFYSSSNRDGQGGGTNRPTSTMNILITIAICLQAYQIYITANHHDVNVDPKAHKASFLGRSLVDSSQLNMYDMTNQVIINQNYPSFRYPQQEMGTEQQEHHQEANNGQINMDGWGPTDDEVLLSGNNETSEEELPFQVSKYNYSLPAIRTNYTLPTQPTPSNESNIAVMVLSGRSNFERRQAIRETWGQNHTNIYFIVGGPEPDNFEDRDMSNPNSTSYRILQEQHQHGDLLDVLHPDTYRGLPYKLHFTIQWFARHPGMKHIQWLLKVDDDVVVRLHTLQYYVLRQYNPLVPIVIGRIEPNSRPHRKGKWAEDSKFFEKFEEYPPWAYGSTGYVVSRRIIDYVGAKNATDLYYYQGEDVSLGIWLYESPLDVIWIDSEGFSIDSNQFSNHKYSVVIGHDLSPTAMRDFFEKWQDPSTKLLDYEHVNHTNTNGVIHETQKKIYGAEAEDMMYYSNPYEGAYDYDGYDFYYRDNKPEEWRGEDESNETNQLNMNPWGDIEARR